MTEKLMTSKEVSFKRIALHKKWLESDEKKRQELNLAYDDLLNALGRLDKLSSHTGIKKVIKTIKKAIDLLDASFFENSVSALTNRVAINDYRLKILEEDKNDERPEAENSRRVD